MKAFALSIVLSLGFLALSVTAMRRQRLREQTALLWLLVSFVMVFLSATLPTHLLNRVSLMLGIDYPPDFILLLAVLFLMGLVFHLSISLDRLSAKQVALVQEIGLMTAKPTSSEGAEAKDDTGTSEASGGGPTPSSQGH